MRWKRRIDEPLDTHNNSELSSTQLFARCIAILFPLRDALCGMSDQTPLLEVGPGFSLVCIGRALQQEEFATTSSRSTLQVRFQDKPPGSTKACGAWGKVGSLRCSRHK